MESVRESVVTSMYIESRRDSSLKQMSLPLAGIKKSSLIQRVQQWRANLNQAVELGQESRLEWLENDVMQSDFKKFELNEAYKKRLLTGVVNHMRNRDTMKAITAWRSYAFTITTGQRAASLDSSGKFCLGKWMWKSQRQPRSSALR